MFFLNHNILQTTGSVSQSIIADTTENLANSFFSSI